MVGGRWDVDVRERLDFQRGWEASLRRTLKTGAVRASPLWIDYFVFSPSARSSTYRRLQSAGLSGTTG